MYGQLDLVKYLLFEQKIFSNTKQTRNVDPRIILMNHDMEDDESFTLRLAIHSGSIEIFKLLWDYYPQLYTEKHLLDITRFALYLRRSEFLVPILASPTSTPVFLSAPIYARVWFVELFDEARLQYVEDKSTII